MEADFLSQEVSFPNPMKELCAHVYDLYQMIPGQISYIKIPLTFYSQKDVQKKLHRSS